MTELKEILKKDCCNIKTNKDLPFSIIFPMYHRVREKELSHSEILRYLLSPEEKHQHREEFISLFFEAIGLDDFSSKITDIEIKTEFHTKASKKSNSRPIDLFISYTKDDTKYGIIIENKLNGAVDQVNQVNDYYDGIKNLGFICSKIVYMHINPLKSIMSTDIKDELKAYCYDYDIRKLISTLQKINQYSYIKEYKNLLTQIDHSFMNFNNAQQIQKELSNEELKQIIEISQTIQSASWNEVKHKRILNELSIKNIKDNYKNNFSEFYFQNYKYWIEVWYYPTSYKIYICSYNKEIDGDEYSEWGEFKKRYFFETDKTEFKFPEEEKEMIEKIKILLEKSVHTE